MVAIQSVKDSSESSTDKLQANNLILDALEIGSFGDLRNEYNNSIMCSPR